MKKLTAILMMITILFTASAFADDLSDRTDPFGFATFADAVKATGGDYMIDSKGYAGAVIEKDGASSVPSRSSTSAQRNCMLPTATHGSGKTEALRTRKPWLCPSIL